MATLSPIGAPLDNLSKPAHVLHLELASSPVLRKVIAWRSLPNMSRHSIISSTSICHNGHEVEE